MNRKLGAGAIAALVVCLVAGTAFAAAKVGSITVKEGALTGKVVDGIGQAMAETKVKVLDKEQQVVASAVAGKDGRYELKGLAAGSYDLRVGEDLGVKLHVAKAARVSDLKLVLPADYAAAEVVLPSSAVGWGIIVGATGLVTWGALEIMHNNEWILRKGGHRVSP